MAGKSTPSQPKLNSALKEEKLTQFLDTLDLEHLTQLAHDLETHISFWRWMANPIEERIRWLAKSISLLGEVIEFAVVQDRYDYFSSIEDTSNKEKLSSILPELREIYNQVLTRINQAPQGIHKAECWLRPIAMQARADGDVEAAVYFASRGYKDILSVDQMWNAWHEQVCETVERYPNVSEEARERAQTKTLSLAEAVDILSDTKLGYQRFAWNNQRLFGYLDDEEDSIDVTMFRIVDWCEITGFEPWLKALVSGLASGPQEGVEHIDDVYRLFLWCRSNLALSIVEQRGLESWLWTLFNGAHEPNKPWGHLDYNQKSPRLRNNVEMAGSLLFIWNRIKPSNVSRDVLDDAAEFLFQTQTRSGAWPPYADSGEPSLFATCCAIHGLALHRPTGWEQAVRRAGDWLWKQQHPRGFWARADVMLTVLVLDSIALAEGRDELTFIVDSSPSRRMLNGWDLEHLRSAILDAYTENELVILLRTKLEEDYDAIVGGQNYSEKAFNLLWWAKRHSRIEELIRALASERPKNEILSEYAIKLGQ